MLVTLGRTPPAETPADLLLACHARIRSFTSLARACAAAADADVPDAAARVARYFTEALPLHVRDEEDSVLPRLRGTDAALDAALDAMAAEHAAHASTLAALRAACATLVARPADVSAREELARVATALEADFAAHLAAEEALVVPALRALDGASQAAVLAEMRGRRGG